jgi:PIN domain nuclease of toxin-antitoxin system
MIVLDTQAWLWWLHDTSRFSARVRQTLNEAEKDAWVNETYFFPRSARCHTRT